MRRKGTSLILEEPHPNKKRQRETHWAHPQKIEHQPAQETSNASWMVANGLKAVIPSWLIPMPVADTRLTPPPPPTRSAIHGLRSLVGSWYLAPRLFVIGSKRSLLQMTLPLQATDHERGWHKSLHDSTRTREGDGATPRTCTQLPR